MGNIALFDMDKTLVRKDTAGLFIRYEYELGKVSAWRVARVFGWRVRYTLGLLPAEDVARRALGWYRGRDIEDLRRETREWAEQCVFPHIGELARETVKRHQQAGDFVAIVTAQTRYAAEPVMEELGIEHLVATELVVEDGKVGAELVEPLCYGEGKLALVKEMLRREFGSDDLSCATAYSDSITDEPLLSAVGVPVAVNPDFRLARLAKARGWRIETW